MASNMIAKTILFTSGKGGVGKSTLSSTAAKLLCARGKRVLIVDCDVSLRTLDIMLSVSSIVMFDWYDVVEENCSPEAALVTTAGPKLLAAPVGDVIIDADDVSKLIKIYESHYDYIILDCPAGVGRVFDATIQNVDMAIVVSTPDRVCARSSGIAVEKAMQNNVETRLIINRFKKDVMKNGRCLNIDEMIDEVNAQLIGVVPEDPSIALSTLNGELLDPNSKSVKAMERIVRRLEGEEVPLKI